VRTLNRYLLREIAIPFGLGLAIVTLILLIARILKLVELVVNRGAPAPGTEALSYILPAFLELTVPMALLLAVLVALGRLSSDSELIALNASGVSLYQLLAPVAAFAAAVRRQPRCRCTHARGATRCSAAPSSTSRARAPAPRSR
jgi:lipopolysaccharide export system permease protein